MLARADARHIPLADGSVTTCAYCGGAVADLGAHYAHNPPAGCPSVAWALDPHWPPERATAERRAGAGDGGVKPEARMGQWVGHTLGCYAVLVANAHGTVLDINNCDCGWREFTASNGIALHAEVFRLQERVKYWSGEAGSFQEMAIEFEKRAEKAERQLQEAYKAICSICAGGMEADYDEQGWYHMFHVRQGPIRLFCLASAVRLTK